MLVEGQREGKLRPTDGSALTQARSMYEVILTPENVIRHAGLRGSLDLARETVLRGALARR